MICATLNNKNNNNNEKNEKKNLNIYSNPIIRMYKKSWAAFGSTMLKNLKIKIIIIVTIIIKKIDIQMKRKT